MQRYIAFLRGINLGNRRLSMDRLKAIFEALEFDEVETFIASGNVLFSSRARETSKLEARIARQLEASLGYSVDTFVRKSEEVLKIGATKIFPEDGHAGITIHVGFFQQKLPPDISGKLAVVRTTFDEFRVNDREFYWLCRGRTSESKVWTLPGVKTLRLPTSTMRNMTSIRKLIARHLA